MNQELMHPIEERVKSYVIEKGPVFYKVRLHYIDKNPVCTHIDITVIPLKDDEATISDNVKPIRLAFNNQ